MHQLYIILFKFLRFFVCTALVKENTERKQGNYIKAWQFLNNFKFFHPHSKLCDMAGSGPCLGKYRSDVSTLDVKKQLETSFFFPLGEMFYFTLLCRTLQNFKEKVYLKYIVHILIS